MKIKLFNVLSIVAGNRRAGARPSYRTIPLSSCRAVFLSRCLPVALFLFAFLFCPLLAAQTCDVPGNLIVPGNIGIGTTSPISRLNIKDGSIWVDGNHAGSNQIVFRNTDPAYYSGGHQYEIYPQGGATVGGLAFYDRTATRYMLMLANGGNVGIGTASPSYQLQLSTDSAAKPGTNTWTVACDARIKTGVREFTDGLAVVEGIRPVWYQYNGKGGFASDGKDNIGVIAQEIETVAPYTVNTYKAKLDADDEKETELLNFNSHALTFVLVNAVKEQQKQIEQLKVENAELAAALNELEARVASLELSGIAKTK